MLTFPSEDARSSFGAAPGNPPIGKERDTVPHYVYDASLLFRRMEMHQIDPTHLAHRDPLLFRELQALCTLCPSKDRCAGDNLSDAMSEASGAYCPNAKYLHRARRQGAKDISARHIGRHSARPATILLHQPPFRQTFRGHSLC
jgi:hypothetical protein